MTLTGFENAPRTMHVGADMPFRLMNVFHGAGVQLVNDQLGLFTHQRLALQYALKLNLLGGTLSTGVQFGVVSEKFRGSGVDTETQNDPAFTRSDVNYGPGCRTVLYPSELVCRRIGNARYRTGGGTGRSLHPEDQSGVLFDRRIQY